MKKPLVLGIAAMLSFSASSFAADWGYDGQTGVYTPADWGQVDAACDGQSQSPIDIDTSAVSPAGKIKAHFEYKKLGSVSYLNNGHGVKVVPGQRYIVVPNGQGEMEKYHLVQFHFHTLSEHTVNGQHYDMELHLVHANQAFLDGDEEEGRLAVLGVFIKEGKKNKVLAKIFNHLPEASHGDEPEVFMSRLSTHNYHKLLPGNRKVFNYQGSLTTPGCNEIVSWFVFKQPIQMSAKQIDDYRELFKDDVTHLRYDTNRPTQPLNGRVVSYGKLNSNRR